MITDLAFLRRLEWGVAKGKLASFFPGWATCPPIPDREDAVGLVGKMFGEPAVLVGYFAKDPSADKLTRVMVNWWLARPPDAIIETMYATVREALVTETGRNPAIWHESGPVPREYKQSETIYWLDPDRVIALSCGLVGDGVPATSPWLGLAVMDPEHDPMARIFS